jgi:hypothetical protein
MALIGRQLTSGNYQKLDDISSQFNSSTKTFNLTTAGQPFYPGSVFSILVSVANVIQEPDTSYTIDQATITFASAPTTGSTFFCIVLGTAFGVGVPADGTVTGTKLSSPFNYNSGLLYLDTTNNRVGILSTSPTVTLDVVGNAKVSGTTNLNGLSVSGITTLSNTTIFNPGPVLVGTATSTGTANQKLQVSGGAYVSSGLGIGTATPSGSLDVSGGSIRVRNNGTYTEPNDNAGVLAYDSNLSEFTVSSRSSSTNSYLRFLTSNSGTSGERVRITAEGNFLVGTASSTGTASQPLQVSGGAYVSANLGVGRANPTYKIDVFGGSGLRVGGVSGDGYLLAYDSSSGNNVILEATDFLTTTKRNLTIQPNGGNVLVGAATSTGTASQPLQVTGGAYVSGNLGIGTTNPTTTLTVQGNANVSGVITATTFSGTLSGYASSAGIATYATNSGISTSVIGGIGSITQLQVTGISTFTNGPVLIGTGTSTGTASQPLQVTGGAYVSGNLGVGVTNPGSKLDIVGDIRFGKQDYSFQSIQKVATLNADGISGVYPTGSFRFYTYPGYINTSTLKLGIRGQDDVLGETSDLVTIVSTSASSGNIGIGTTNPSQKLHVQGNVRITGGLYDFNNGAGSTGQILQSVGTGISWTTFSGGSTITVSDDTSTNATRYLVFEDVTSGTSSSINVSSTKLTFNPSTGALSATDFNSTSDINLKENIKPIENSLDKIMQLNGIEFDWKENKKPSIGVIAQEVEKVFPSLVKTAENKSVNYNGLVGVLIEAIKELKKEVEDLKIAKYT